MSGRAELSILRYVAALALAVWRTLASGKSRRAFAAAAWRWLAENPVPVIVSVSLATAIYLGVHDRPTEEFVRNIAVKVRGAPEGSRVGIDPPTVRVVFRGERADMIGMDMSPPVIYVNYPGDQALRDGGEYPMRLRGKNVRFSGLRGFGSVSVVGFDPENVTLVGDTIETLSFEIESPKLEGVPSSGFRAEVSGIKPERAAVTGGGRSLRGWKGLGLQLRLAPVSIDGLGHGEHPRMAEILPPIGEDAMDMRFEPAKAEVTVRVSPQLDPLTLEGIPVRLSFPQGYAFPPGIMVEPQTVGVTLVGAKEQLSNVAASNVVVYAELAEDAPPLSATNALEVTLVARLPQDKSILEANVSPSTVRITAIAPEATAAPEQPPDDETVAGEPEDGPAGAPR